MATRNKFKCPQCPKVLYSKPYLDRHLKTRHPKEKLTFFCDFDGKQFSTKDLLRIHMQRHSTNILACMACMKSYTSMHTFRKHLKSHIQQFDCKECPATFSHKSLLINHIASKHNDELNHKCHYCSREFASASARNSHHQVAHKNKTSELIFNCDKCKISFETREDLRIHSFIHFEGEIKACHLCDQIFKTNRLLKIHLQKHSEKKYKCEDCGQNFTYKSGLRKHTRLNRCKGSDFDDGKEKSDEIKELAMNQLIEISTFDPRIKKKKKKVIQIPIKNNVEEIKKVEIKPKRPQVTLICDKCGETTKYRKRLELHMREKHFNRKYQCKHCPESFKSRQKFLDHLLASHGIKSRIAKEIFNCDKCERKFDVKSIFEAHMSSHLDVRPQICDTCGMSFKSVSNLRRHESSVHATSRSEICEVCEKSFKTKIALKIHQQTVHVDMKVYVNCYYCNSIVLEKNLKSHIHNIHSEEGQARNFQCDSCQKSFKNEYLMKRHCEAVHELADRGITYKCSSCEFTTTRQRDLKDHELNEHFDGPIHVCECGKRFKSRKLLMIHMTSHNQSTDFQCNFCDTSYKTRSGLRKHMVKYHQNAEGVGEKFVEIFQIDC